MKSTLQKTRYGPLKTTFSFILPSSIEKFIFNWAKSCIFLFVINFNSILKNYSKRSTQESNPGLRDGRRGRIHCTISRCLSNNKEIHICEHFHFKRWFGESWSVCFSGMLLEQSEAMKNDSCWWHSDGFIPFNICRGGGSALERGKRGREWTLKWNKFCNQSCWVDPNERSLLC